MMVVNSFDSWQKDAFFSAAEEVQQSADRMESVYRRWLKEKRDVVKLEDFNELYRELQIVLGTAKWQLEEFEKAVRLSYGNRDDDITLTRHRNFVVAIESQISRVETALREAIREQGHQPLRWVNLDKEEHDDLAQFLSGTSQFVPASTAEHVELGSSRFGNQVDCDRNIADETEGLENSGFVSGRDLNHVIDIETKDSPGSGADVVCQMDRSAGTRKTSSPNFGALRIVVSDDDRELESQSSTEVTPKDKGFKPFDWRQIYGAYFRARVLIDLYNKVVGRLNGYQRQLQGPRKMQYSRSIRVALALMLSLFLIVPFLYYSS